MLTRKGQWAAIAGVLWLLSFDVVPMAHMVFHETLEEHHHGHHHDHAATHEHEEEAPTPAEHGEGSAAHRDLAANVPAPSVPEVLEALFTWAAPAAPSPDEPPADRQPQTSRARAPPSAAA